MGKFPVLILQLKVCAFVCQQHVALLLKNKMRHGLSFACYLVCSRLAQSVTGG